MNSFWQSLCLFAQQEAPAGDGGPPGGLGPLVSFLPWILIGIVFYLLLVRPERRKRTEHEVMLKNLKKNDRVVTVGGIMGTVVQTSQDAEDVTLRVDENTNTRIRVLRSSISRVISADGAAESSPT